MKIEKLWCYANILRSIPALLAYKFSPVKALIDADITVWSERRNIRHLPTLMKINWLLVYLPEFRNLFYHRIKKSNRLLSIFLSLFYPKLNSLYIYTSEIGGGLYIEHGFSTIITAQSIGENCWINQQVTIGFTEHGYPTIGDNVRIGAGAKVIGSIRIGNDAKVGAGAIIVKDVPAHCTVVGVAPRYLMKEYAKKKIN